MFSWLFVFWMVICVKDGYCSEEEIADDADHGQVFIVGGVLLLIGFVVLVALCVDEVHHTADLPPAWTNIVQVDNSINKGFGGVSDGMRIINPNCVQRTRTGDYEADGAKWGAPLKKGKHIFEINWPRVTRGTLATVGVGNEHAPLVVKPKASLVGCNKYSWGLDIARYKCLHRDQQITTMPRNKLIPDTFYMYVDCESGTLGFGTEHAYWGAPINIPQSEFPVYPMVGSVQHMSQITIKYKGSALNTAGDTGYNQSIPVTTTTTTTMPAAPEEDKSETYVAPIKVSGL